MAHTEGFSLSSVGSIFSVAGLEGLSEPLSRTLIVLDKYTSVSFAFSVYVVPAFELKNEIQVPSTKKELLNLWNLGNVRPFYETVCWKCQRYTDYPKWRE